MTMRERMLACYRRQPTDRSACAIYTRYLPRSEAEREVRNLGMGVIDYVPPVTMMPPPWHMLDGFLSQIEGAKVCVDYRWEGGRRFERRSFVTPDGTLYADVESDAGGVGSEHLIHRYLNQEEDYRAMLYVARNARFARNDELFRSRMNALGGDGVVLGRLDRSPFQKCLIELANPESFFFDLMDVPEIIEELIDVLGERMLEAAEMALDGPAEVLWIPDNVTAEMTSPSLFEKYCLPYYKKLTKLVHSADKILLAHFDGKIRPLLPSLVQAGFDGVESLSLPEMSGDMTVQEARQALPDTAILPNFPANRSFMEFEEIVEWACGLEADCAGEPLLLQISEDLPPELTMHVARALATAFR